MRSFIYLVFAMTLVLASMPCWGAIDTDIAISSQAGWFGQGAATREAQEIVDNVAGDVNDIKIFPAADKGALGTWVEDHTDNGKIDFLLLCGQFPDTIYAAGNAEADDSLAELFLEGGNIIGNTGDYMFYVVNGAGTNAAGGLANMMDIPGITMWDDDTPVEVTADGEKYLPSLNDFNTDRPFHLNELLDPWETEVMFAVNGGETRADPVVVLDTDTGGRLIIFYQTAGQDADPRGEVISEFILNWMPTIVGKSAVSPGDKFSTLWGELKADY